MQPTDSPLITHDPRHAPPFTRPRHIIPAHEVAPDVLLHPLMVNTYALRTGNGLLIIDPGLAQNSQSVYSAVRAWNAELLHTPSFIPMGISTMPSDCVLFWRRESGPKSLPRRIVQSVFNVIA